MVTECLKMIDGNVRMAKDNSKKHPYVKEILGNWG